MSYTIILSIIYDHTVDIDNSLNINMTRQEFNEYVNETYFKDEGYGNKRTKHNRRKFEEKTRKKRGNNKTPVKKMRGKRRKTKRR